MKKIDLKKALILLFVLSTTMIISAQNKDKKDKKKDTTGVVINYRFPIEPPPDDGGGNTYPWNRDADNDGYGDPLYQIEYATKPAGYVADRSDCNDGNSNIHPGAPEILDGLDNDCDGLVDEGLAPTNPIIIPIIVRLSDENYTHQISPQIAVSDLSQLTEYKHAIQNATYFDGLGRPMQSIGIKQSASQKDIITHITYDDLGRKSKEYLPYAASDIEVDASYRTNALISTNSFYNTTKYENTTNPYSEQFFDGSPLNIVVETAAPGNIWKEGIVEEHTIKNENKLIENTDQVNNFQVIYNAYGTPSLVNKGLFTIGEGALQSDPFKAPTLYKFITKNENWSTQQINLNDNTTQTFKDFRGRTILSRTFESSESNVRHDTYYVYDTYGNLIYVITPNVDVSNGVSSSELSLLCYQYKYDGKSRLIEKQLPGKGREYVVYDQLNRPVLTQDALQKLSNKWLFSKYDANERVVYTGIYTANISRPALQSQIDALPANSPLYETKGNAITVDGTPIYYSNNVFPNTSIQLLTINYYDDYNFDLGATFNPNTNNTLVYAKYPTLRTKGLQTGAKTKVLETGNWISTVSYYDEKARPVYVYSYNSFLQTTDVVQSKLDFVGKAEEVKTTHNKTGQSTITATDYFTYDHVGRLLQQSQVLTNSNKEVIVQNTYDELGQLTTKGVGGLSTATKRLQTVKYTYNIRGWLKQINNPASLGTDLFGFKIGYTDGNKPLYNGNISNTEWKTQSGITSANPISYKYNYSYDALNRIKSGIDNTGNYNLTSVDYDKNGNITHLNRKGNRDANATIFGEMDNLSYYYNGNQLHSVTDASVTTGFNDANSSDTSYGTLTNNDYKYDVNGNLIEDKNKGITAITYNYLNLPTKVTMAGGNILYFYDATGVKLRKTVSTGITTDYAGNYVYKNGALQFFNQPEGYVEPNGSAYKYVYQYKDHLGNIRLSYKDNNGTLEIVEENNYYPFGLKHQGYNFNHIGRDHKYGFGNKEEQDDDLGGNKLDWLDFGARNYDPALGRWMNMDPLAEQMRRYSPYNYAFNNPMYFIDPDGMKSRPGGFDEAQWVEEPDYDNRGDEFLNGKTYAGGGFDGSSFSFSGEVQGDPPVMYKGPGVAIGENAVNALDEVVVTGKSNGGSSNSGLAMEIGGGTYGALKITATPGNQWLGKNGIYYNNSWGGNQYAGSRSGAFTAANNYKWAGRATVGVSLIIGGMEVYDGYQKDGGQFGYNAAYATGSTTGGMVGAWAGAEAGATAGAALGVWFGGVGAVPGAIIGGFVGGILGSYTGSYVGERSANYYYLDK